MIAKINLKVAPAAKARMASSTAVRSALTFVTGGSIPLITALLLTSFSILFAMICVSLAALVILGALVAYGGGASLVRGALRVLLLGGVALLVTTLVGYTFKIAA